MRRNKLLHIYNASLQGAGAGDGGAGGECGGCGGAGLLPGRLALCLPPPAGHAQALLY